MKIIKFKMQKYFPWLFEFSLLHVSICTLHFAINSYNQ